MLWQNGFIASVPGVKIVDSVTDEPPQDVVGSGPGGERIEVLKIGLCLVQFLQELVIS